MKTLTQTAWAMLWLAASFLLAGCPKQVMQQEKLMDLYKQGQWGQIAGIQPDCEKAKAECYQQWLVVGDAHYRLAQQPQGSAHFGPAAQDLDTGVKLYLQASAEDQRRNSFSSQMGEFAEKAADARYAEYNQGRGDKKLFLEAAGRLTGKFASSPGAPYYTALLELDRLQSKPGLAQADCAPLQKLAANANAGEMKGGRFADNWKSLKGQSRLLIQTLNGCQMP